VTLNDGSGEETFWFIYGKKLSETSLCCEIEKYPLKIQAKPIPE